MAFTKVAPAGIGSTPGDGYRIGDSFLHSTGVEITNINATGIVTAASLDISGSIDVDGHTNLDNVSIAGVTTITGSGTALEIVGGVVRNRGTTSARFVANNGSAEGYFGWSSGVLTVGQASATLSLEATGSNHIQLKTGGSEKLRIDNNGKLILSNSEGIQLSAKNSNLYLVDGSISYYGTTNAVYVNGAGVAGWLRLNAAGATNNRTAINIYGHNYSTGDTIDFRTNSNERLRITSTGTIGINSTSPGALLDLCSGQPGILFSETDVSANNGKWLNQANASELYWQAQTDAHSGGGNLFKMTRSNEQIQTFEAQQAGVSWFTIRNSNKTVGIGTNNPDAPLLIYTDASQGWKFRINTSVSDGAGFYQRSNGDFEVVLRDASNNNNFISGNNGGLEFATSGTDKFRIDSSGRSLFITNGSQTSPVADNNVPLQIAETTSNMCYFGANKGNSYGSIFGHHTAYGGTVIRNLTSDDIVFMTNNSSERLRILANGNVSIGNAVNAGNTLRYFDVYNTNTGSSAGAILRLLTTKSDGSSSTGLDIVKYKAGGAYIINNENVGADTGFIAFNTASSGTSPATHLKVAGNGEVIVSPRNGGASNNRTSIHFNNSAHSPFIAFKSNNLTEAAYIKIDESSGGANINLQCKNTSGTLLSRLTLKNNGEIVTHQLGGSEKAYPLVMGTGTVAQNTNMSGHFNYHDVRGCHNTSNNNYSIGGWVFLGNDQAAAPYPVRRFKIAAPGGFSNGTIVYQVWHDGDSNYDYGGLYEIRINCWTGSSRFESVAFRCVNGKRDDLKVYAYDDSNGIMIQPSSIWGRCFIRKAGWDDAGRNPGSSYCAVANNGPLATYNAQETDDGAIPSGGFELYTYPEGTGGRDIENSNSFPG